MFNEQLENTLKIYNLEDPEITPLLSPYLKDEFIQDRPLIDNISASGEVAQILFKMESAVKPGIGKFHVSFLSVIQVLQQFVYLFTHLHYPDLPVQVELKTLDLLLKKLIYADKDIPVTIKILNTFALDKQRIFQCKLDFAQSSFTGTFDFAVPTSHLPEKNINLAGEELLQLLKPYFNNIYLDGSQGILRDLAFHQTSAHATSIMELKSEDPILQSLQRNTFTLVNEAQLSIIYGLWYLDFQNKPGPVILTRLKRQLHHKDLRSNNHLSMQIKKELKKGTKNFLSLHSTDELYDNDFNLCIIEGFDENF